jgi:hypothetical protein
MKKKLLFIVTIIVLFISLFILIRFNIAKAVDFTKSLATIHQKLFKN